MKQTSIPGQRSIHRKGTPWLTTIGTKTSTSANPAGGGGDVPNYLVQSILVTLCCCLPFGIVAIVSAAKVNGLLASGDYEGAVKASEDAKKWCWGVYLG